jgi:hypothetical protein
MANNKDSTGMKKSLLAGFIDTMDEDRRQLVIDSLDELGFWRKH